MLAGKKCQSRTSRTRTTGTPNTVNVILDAIGKVVVDDHLHILDVYEHTKSKKRKGVSKARIEVKQQEEKHGRIDWCKTRRMLLMNANAEHA